MRLNANLLAIASLAIVIIIGLVMQSNSNVTNSEIESLNIKVDTLHEENKANLQSQQSKLNDIIDKKFRDLQEFIVSKASAPDIIDKKFKELQEFVAQSKTGSVSLPCKDTDQGETFLAIATRAGTDKVGGVIPGGVAGHDYEIIYDKYLPILRKQGKVKMLEIGLGCDMFYGPGRSMKVWDEYFKDVERKIYFMEVDGACVEKHKDKLTPFTEVYVGSQNDREFLRKFLNETGGEFDLIIDDGGHKMSQQRATLEELFKGVKHGGFYALEDSHTSFLANWIDSRPLTTEVLKHIIDYFNNGLKLDPSLVTTETPEKADYIREIKTMDCMAQMCMFTRK